MPERIGFDRKIRRAWLDLTAEVVRDTLSNPKSQTPNPITVVNAALDRALMTEIRGSDARRTSINVLTRLWLRVPEAQRSLRDEALAFWPDLAEAERLWLHWGLALLAYPFLRDVASIVGRLLRLQERFTTGQVHRQIVARWGERTTLEYAVQRAIASLTDWGVLLAGENGRGPYVAASPLTTEHAELPLWLLEAALQAHPADALSLYDLLRLPELFPFDLDIGSGSIHRSPRFLIQREGDNVEMAMTRRVADKSGTEER